MRVIIKPAGFIMLLVMLSVLGSLAFLRNRSSVGKAPVTKIASRTVTSSIGQKNLLVNGGFEGNSEKVVGAWPNSLGTATGIQGKGWLENSLWGKIKLIYALDKENPHSGGTSQRIRIESNVEGQVQFVQECPAVVGKKYEATVWIRASEENLPVSLALRQAGTPYKPYKQIDATAGKEWQKISVVAAPTEIGNMFTMVTFRKAGATLWIDDASLTEVP